MQTPSDELLDKIRGLENDKQYPEMLPLLEKHMKQTKEEFGLKSEMVIYFIMYSISTLAGSIVMFATYLPLTI
jgi:hypothetical protein